MSGKIGFTEGFMNMDQLIAMINHYASIHNIPIEVQANGVKTITSRLWMAAL